MSCSSVVCYLAQFLCSRSYPMQSCVDLVVFAANCRALGSTVETIFDWKATENGARLGCVTYSLETKIVTEYDEVLPKFNIELQT